jgi:anti-sigma B factor antagonist
VCPQTDAEGSSRTWTGDSRTWTGDEGIPTPRQAQPPPPTLACRLWSLPDGSPLLEIAGEVDVTTADGLRAELTAVIDQGLEQGSSGVVVDLAQVSFIDSTGLTALLAGLRHARSKVTDGVLRLVGPTSSVRKVLAITGLDQVFPTHESLDELPAGPNATTRPSTDWHPAGGLG